MQTNRIEMSPQSVLVYRGIVDKRQNLLGYIESVLKFCCAFCTRTTCDCRREINSAAWSWNFIWHLVAL